jgi:hypothetical protein
MDHEFSSCIMPINSLNNDPDQTIRGLPTVPHEGLHSTLRSADTMSVGDINHLVPAHPISTYNYTSVPSIQQEPASMQQAVLFNSTSPFLNNGYHHHLQQTLMPDNTGIFYDNKHSFHDERWMQFGFSSIDSNTDGASNNETNGLEISDQISSLPSEPPASKKCEWKGCTFPRPFRRDAELMRHFKTVHVSRDAYKCPVCGKAFGRKDKMEHHRRTHT